MPGAAPVSATLEALEHPIVQAPMGGGPGTAALAAAVSGAGGLGFLAAGYQATDAVRADVEAVRATTERPFGVNVFAPPGPAGEPAAIARYAAALAGEAARSDVELGEPRHHDDGWAAKLALLAELRVPIVSTTFGCPSPAAVAELQGAGVEVWVTVTSPEEAVTAAAAGVDALVVQGVEAGGHRASFDDAAPGDYGLLALLQLVRAQVALPLVASGGLATGRAVAAVLVAGARAAQLGTAFMRTPEAATSGVHRQALASTTPTALTRAFTGRTARGLVNRFLAEHGDEAPSAYPEVHHLTAPLRAAARSRGDADAVNLWAGQAHALGAELPAAELVRDLSRAARAAVAEAVDRLGSGR
jgi:nitronate monooxygenase